MSNDLAFLGEALYPGDPNLNGTIDEFRVYNNALTDTEVMTNFTTGPTNPITLPQVQVNRGTGEIKIRNISTRPMTFDQFRIGSAAGALLPSFVGLSGAGGASDGINWDQAGGNDATELSEIRLDGNGTLAAGAEASLGIGYFPAIFGNNTIDLTFTFNSNSPTPNETVTGTVSTVGAFLGVQGDYNGNGVVDTADYVYWREFIGTTRAYNIWREHFGNVAGSGTSVSSGGTVPEPATLALLVASLIGIAGSRRRAQWRMAQ